MKIKDLDDTLKNYFKDYVWEQLDSNIVRNIKMGLINTLACLASGDGDVPHTFEDLEDWAQVKVEKSKVTITFTHKFYERFDMERDS